MRTRSLREEVGSAVNSSDLRGKTTTLLNAFAVGSNRLGELLWRLRYGSDKSVQTRRAAVFLITHIINDKRGRIPSARLLLVVEQALTEWLEDRCPECRGRKYTGTEFGDITATRIPCPAKCVRPRDARGNVIPNAATVLRTGVFNSVTERALNAVSCQRCAGRSWVGSTMVDASKTIACRACEGTGRAFRSQGSRAAAVGLTRPQFQRYWAKSYDRALTIMREADTVTGRTVSNAMRFVVGAPGLEQWSEEDVERWLREHSR